MDDFSDFEQKRYQNHHTEQNLYCQKIEPWKDEPHSLPLQLIKTQSEKFKIRQQKMRRFASLQLNSKSISMSPKKERASKELPKMNIGNNIQPVKNSQSRPKSVQMLKKKRKSEVSLPTVSVARELMIERKLYLMKKKIEGQSPSPKKRCLRDIVEQKAIMK